MMSLKIIPGFGKSGTSRIIFFRSSMVLSFDIGWVELLPCGMIHPNVLKAGGIDPEVYNGFAFGLGLDRLVMMRYAIDDIHRLQSGDLRFNSQFKLF